MTRLILAFLLFLVAAFLTALAWIALRPRWRWPEPCRLCETYHPRSVPHVWTSGNDGDGDGSGLFV